MLTTIRRSSGASGARPSSVPTPCAISVGPGRCTEPVVAESGHRLLCAQHALTFGITRLLQLDGYFTAYFARLPLPGSGLSQLVVCCDFMACRFGDGLIVYPGTCPVYSIERSHWATDGSCACPDELK